MNRFEFYYRVPRGACAVEAADHDRFGRVARTLALFAYAGAGWALLALALFGLADSL